jgi:pyridoxamine 5'-phosphate oxidase
MSIQSDFPPFDFSQDPIWSFENQLKKATALVPKDPNAMTIGTVSADGAPSLRTVLLKGMANGGLVFFTNYESQKSKEMLMNDRASALFFWATLEQQIRFEGRIAKTSRAENEEYFKTRPRLSQIGAWASQQSQVIPNKEFLERRVLEFEKQFEGQEVPCPPHWGGWRLEPLHIEFWFGRGGRLHDRYVFERTTPQQEWVRSLKSP